MQAVNRHKKRRDSLIAQGICCQCGRQQAMPNQVYCGYCQEYKTDLHRYYYHYYGDRGFCPRHHKVRSAPGKKHCQWCLDKDKERKQLAKSKSLETKGMAKDSAPSV